jgi:DNA-binding Lrp family transcriptional regulator
VPDGPLILTEFDRDILTELYHTGQVTIAGVDPRISVSRIARRLKTSRARVAARIREWERSGLLRGYDVWPNPALFGVVGGSVDLRLADRLRKPEIFRRIALVDGVVGALEFLGDWVSVQLMAPEPSSLERRVRLLGGLEGVAEVGPLFPWANIEVERTLSPLEIRIIRALRHDPRGSLAEIAKAVGVSTRTMTARYGALLDQSLVWFLPSYDFTALASPIVALTLQLRSAEERSTVLTSLRKRLPWFLEFGTSGFGPIFDPKLVTVFVFAPSAAGVEAVERTARELPGVAGAEANVMVRVVSFPDAFESLLAAAAGETPTKDRRPTGADQRAQPARPRSR